MWDEFYKDIDGEKFASRKEYELYVRGWVEDAIDQAGRIERWALAKSNEDACDELNIKIVKP